jgi:hypothetical protein
LVCPKQSLWIVGRNLLLTFGLNFARCLTSRIDKQQHIILSRTAHRKTALTPQGCAVRMRRRGDMVRGVTLLTPRTPCAAEGRQWYFPDQGCFWHSNWFS